MRRVRERPLLLMALAAAALAGCRSTSGGKMVADPPPPGWEKRILADRAEKNDEFRLDPDTPLLKSDLPSFKGLEYWRPDPAYRFRGPIHRYDHPSRFTILSTTGKERPCEKYGWISFDLRGRLCTLQVYRLLDVKDVAGVAALFLPFTDATTGKQTYPAGRYVDLEGPDAGPYVLDFNRAYNPLCAYGAPERFRCPVTPAENHLAVRVEAGERGYKRHGEAG